MQGLNRLTSVLAVTLAMVTMVTMIAGLACDKDGGAAPPAPAGDGKPAAPETPPPVAGDAPPVEAGAPTEGTGANVTCTPDTRKGGMCTREYSPVCGTLADNTSKTFSNKCVACSDEKVVRYVAGQCAGGPPG